MRGKFCRVALSGQKIVTRMLTRDLLAVADIHVVLLKSMQSHMKKSAQRDANIARWL